MNIFDSIRIRSELAIASDVKLFPKRSDLTEMQLLLTQQTRLQYKHLKEEVFI